MVKPTEKPFWHAAKPSPSAMWLLPVPELPTAMIFSRSAIAAFQLSQFCFSALVQNGIVPKPDAERLLRQTVQTNKTGGPGNQAAADLLAIFLNQVTKFQPPTRQ